MNSLIFVKKQCFSNVHKIYFLSQFCSSNWKINKYSDLNAPDTLKERNLSILLQQYEVLNIDPKSSIRDIYKAYKRYALFYNPNVYYEKDRDYKYSPIKNAYLKIIKQKAQQKELLNEKDVKDLESLIKNGYGLLFETNLTKTEIIIELSNQEIQWSEPENFTYILLFIWVSLGIVSLTIDYTENSKNK